MSSAEQRPGPLTGVRVLDLSRLAPGPYCTMLLADMGAEVIAVGGGRAGLPVGSFARGKRFIALDLKAAAGRDALQRLADTSDVLVESFRPGVAARLGAGYDELAARNPRLVYCSLTGYGQQGPLAQAAGHDLNYLALTGVLGSMGPVGQPPTVPLNLIADFAGGSLFATLGILAALYERQRDGRGRCIDAAMIDGCLSLMAMHSPVWGSAAMPAAGAGWLSGAAPYYRCYACADGRHVSVGALEPQFFAALWAEFDDGAPPDQLDCAQWPLIEQTLARGFGSQPRDAWVARFAGRDACVLPVLTPQEAWQHPHVAQRHPDASPAVPPTVPRFRDGALPVPPTDTADHTEAVLSALGLSAQAIAAASPLHERQRRDDPRGTWPPPLQPARPHAPPPVKQAGNQPAAESA